MQHICKKKIGLNDRKIFSLAMDPSKVRLYLWKLFKRAEEIIFQSNYFIYYLNI